MKNERTLTIIKPNATKHTTEIIEMIETAGFEIIAEKKLKLSIEQTKEFYEIHKNRPFYKELCEFMSSDECTVLVLSKQNAVNTYRNLMGPTNPKDAQKGTIREKFGEGIQENAVHGSDSLENAEREIKFFFPELSI
ncbi:MAG: nucleoside-diphosphate kinase [Holosporales bacterium]|nr:nucleoside-diphosphate kinase [Holosporales bacterium]